MTRGERVPWDKRLETAAQWSLALSLIASVGDAPPYNVVLALLMLLAHHTRRGRHVYIALWSLGLSIPLDAVWLLRVDLHDRWNVLALAATPLNAILKLLGAVACYYVFVSLGGMWSLVESHVGLEGSEHGGGLATRTPSAVDRVGGASFSELHPMMPPMPLGASGDSNSTGGGSGGLGPGYAGRQREASASFYSPASALPIK